MRSFFKFIILKVFFTGVRKFITMAAIAYGFYSVSGTDQMRKFADLSSYVNQKFNPSQHLDSPSRSLASSDNLNFKTNTGSRNKIKKKKTNFFRGLDKTEDGYSNTVNDLAENIKKDREGIDYSRGVATKGFNLNKDTEVKLDKPQKSDPAGRPNVGCNFTTDSNCGAPSSVPNPLPSSDPEPDRVPSTSPDSETISNKKTITCFADRAEGLFGSSISVNLSCSETAEITYCVSTSGECDPLSTPINYVGAIDLNAGDNIYYVSFYGLTSDGAESNITRLVYEIDSTLPALIVNFPRIQTQSTELPIVNQTQSSDYGKANYFYTQINLKSHDPTGAGLNWSCEDIKNMYSSLTLPAVSIIQDDLSTASLLVSDQIEQSIGSSDLEAGNNFVVTLFEDRTREIISCQIQNIILEDTFNAAFTGTGATPLTVGVRKTIGGFIGYGHFQGVPNTSTSGANENLQSSTINKSDLFNIVY